MYLTLSRIDHRGCMYSYCPGQRACMYRIVPGKRAHGRSQLKHIKLSVGGYDYLRASAHPVCEVSCQGVPNRPASSLCPCFIKASRMVHGDPHCQTSAALVACSTRASCCGPKTLRTRLRTGVCKTLMPDVVQEFSMVGGYT